MLQPNNTGTEPSAGADPAMKLAQAPSQMGSDIGECREVVVDIARL